MSATVDGSSQVASPTNAPIGVGASGRATSRRRREGARGSALHDLRGRRGAGRHLVPGARDRGRDGPGQLDEPRRVVPDEEIARRPAPSFFALRHPGGAEDEVRDARISDPVGDPLRDPGRVPRPRVSPRAQDGPRDRAEVERLGAGAWLVEARAEPADAVLAGLEGAERGGEIGGGMDHDLVEERRALGGARAAGEDERVAASIGAEGAGAVGSIGGEVGGDDGDERARERAEELLRVVGREDERAAPFHPRRGDAGEPAARAERAGAGDRVDGVARVEGTVLGGADAGAEGDAEPGADRLGVRLGERGDDGATVGRRIERIEEGAAEDGAGRVVDPVRIDRAGRPGEVERERAPDRGASAGEGAPRGERDRHRREERVPAAHFSEQSRPRWRRPRRARGPRLVRGDRRTARARRPGRAD